MSEMLMLDGLEKTYNRGKPGEVQVLRGASLSLKRGEVVALVAPSGAGKSTMLHIAGLLDSPDRGRVVLDDMDMTRLNDDMRTGARRGQIGFIYQFHHLLPEFSALENIIIPQLAAGVAKGVAEARAMGLLERVGVAARAAHRPAALSGGEQQRVALARAIVIRPGVLLFDEPLSNLDAKLRVQMRQEIRALQRRLGITTLYVTHDQEEAMAVSDRIVVMNQGRVAQVGSAQDLYLRPTSEFVARFIGRINAVPAELLASAGPGVEVMALGQRLRLPVATPAAGLPLQLMLRPEALRLVSANQPGAWPATVSSCTFLGDKVEVELRCAGQALLAVCASLGHLPVAGDQVGLAVETASMLLLPSESGA